MNHVQAFVDTATGVCARPGMYVPRGTFFEVVGYLNGYLDAASNNDLKEWWYGFTQAMQRHYGFPRKYVWWAPFQYCSIEDEQAIGSLGQQLNEFLSRTMRLSLQEAISSYEPLNHDCQGEPEQTLRRLLAAILSGDQAQIAPLVQPCDGVSILWSKQYPQGVASQLHTLSQAQPIARIAGSEDQGFVRLICADFPFPVSVERSDDRWRVNVEQLVAMQSETAGGRGGA